MASGHTMRALSLVPLADANAGQPMPSAARYSFGLVSGAQAQHVEHTFVLRNNNKAPLAISEMKSACRCTTANPVDAVTHKEVSVISPGETILVRVVVDLTSLAAGTIDKSVLVMVKGQTAPAATLWITGGIPSRAVFTPGFVDFGRVPAGSAVSRIVTVTLGADLPAQGGTPKLIAASPAITITPLPPPAPPKVHPSVSPRPGPAASAMGDSPKARPVTKSFLVTLAPHNGLGVVQDRLYLVFTTGSHTTDKSEAMSVPYNAEISGAIAASPSTIAFGTVPYGQSSHRQIILTGFDLTGLKVTRGSKYLFTDFRILSDPKQPGQHRSALLDVAIIPNTPTGPLKTSVTITAAGQQLTLPVYGLVEAAGK